jgi:hypothetical protein
MIPEEMSQLGAPSPQGGFRIWVLVWLVVFASCLAPAALNHLPMTFGDTQGYLAVARSFRPSHERAYGYGAFLRASGGLLSLWLPAIAQAALAAYPAVRLLSLEATDWPSQRRILLLGGFCAILVTGHLPWEASFIMPDISPV